MTSAILKALAVTAGLTVMSAGVTIAADCGFLNRDPLSLRDTELFYKLPRSNEWKSLDESSVALGNQTLSFAYVVQEKLDQRRSGVVVVKSGRNRVAGEPISSAPKIVRLVRTQPDNNDDGSKFDNGSCGPIPEFGTDTISAASYDKYHDLGSKVPEQSVLDRFHYRYLGRRDRCRRTDNGYPDSKIPPVDRSNRGQFSFNRQIVGVATDSQIAALVSPESAYAGSSEGLAEQRVEMKAYRARAGLPTCVLFSLTVPASTGFVRINDLEGLTRRDLYYVRSDERAWSLSR
jgi:hypothetical protein